MRWEVCVAGSCDTKLICKAPAAIVTSRPALDSELLLPQKKKKKKRYDIPWCLTFLLRNSFLDEHE